MVTTGILPHKEISHGRAGNRTRDLVISSQKHSTVWDCNLLAVALVTHVNAQLFNRLLNTERHCSDAELS